MFGSGPGEDRILLFSTDENLNLLETSESCYVDGTFKSVPKLFCQLYTIHARCDGQVFPLVYALLPDKQRVTYDRLLAALATLRDTLEPHQLLSDFEKPAIQAFQHAYPLLRVTGCLFHLAQNIYKHVQEYGLQVPYSQDQEFFLLVRMISALAFVPQGDVVRYWELLKPRFPGTYAEGEQILLRYFERYYIGEEVQDGP
eukprot:scpid64432/ scgid32466/ 